MEWVLQSLTSWSRLRECRAGELNNICVVSDESMSRPEVKGGLDWGSDQQRSGHGHVTVSCLAHIDPQTQTKVLQWQTFQIETCGSMLALCACTSHLLVL